MTINLQVTSESKGSNPGGRCRVYNGVHISDAYYKYVHGSRLKNGTSFRADHQAVYEAMTFELVRSLGLDTSNTYVLINKNRDVNFSDWKEHAESDPNGRDFYFVSEILRNPRDEMLESESRAILDHEGAYLDALMVSDVIGKRQNYMPYGEPGNRKIVYLDLGCSFVRAVDGFLMQPHRVHLGNGKEFKKALKDLGKIGLWTPRQYPVNLAHIIHDIPELSIKVLNPEGVMKASDLITDGEIHEIQMILAQSLLSSVPRLDRRGLITNNL